MASFPQKATCSSWMVEKARLSESMIKVTVAWSTYYFWMNCRSCLNSFAAHSLAITVLWRIMTEKCENSSHRVWYLMSVNTVFGIQWTDQGTLIFHVLIPISVYRIYVSTILWHVEDFYGKDDRHVEAVTSPWGLKLGVALSAYYQQSM